MRFSSGIFLSHPFTISFAVTPLLPFLHFPTFPIGHQRPEMAGGSFPKLIKSFSRMFKKIPWPQGMHAGKESQEIQADNSGVIDSWKTYASSNIR